MIIRIVSLVLALSVVGCATGGRGGDANSTYGNAQGGKGGDANNNTPVSAAANTAIALPGGSASAQGSVGAADAGR